MEFKRSTVAVSEGIRQNLDNQQHTFIHPFFTTIQLLLAGNETEGLMLQRDRNSGEILAVLERSGDPLSKPAIIRCCANSVNYSCRCGAGRRPVRDREGAT